MATFWRTFHHDGKFSPAWGEGAGSARPPLFTLSTITNKVVVRQVHSSFFSCTLFPSVERYSREYLLNTLWCVEKECK
jgi:hypothetical protein